MDSQFTLNDLKTHVPMPYFDPQMSELKEGQEIGKYRLVEQAGQGGMGVVWKAYDTVGERYVALKFVPAEIRHREDAMEQVKTVFSRIQALNHQHICPVHALEKDERLGYYVVMKWLEGQSLDKLARSGILREKNLIIPILKAVASALDYAHSRKVLHRDVKPSNIFVTIENGKITEVNLIDFGLASEIHNTLSQYSNREIDTSGTRPYMPPEQWQGKRQTERTDQYSLGIVAYELFAGNLPFQIPDVAMLRLAIMQDAPDEIKNVPDTVNTAIFRALAKNPIGRFGSCTEFAEALEKRVVTLPPIDATTESQQGKTVEEIEAEEYQRLRTEWERKHAEEVQKQKEAKAKELRKHAEEDAKKRAAERLQAELEAMNKPKGSKAGDLWTKTVDGIEYRFRWCPPGDFMMGSPAPKPREVTKKGLFWNTTETIYEGGEEGRFDDETQHRVTLTKGFWMLETEVTQAMWESVMGNNPSEFKGAQNPVECVSWDECQDFCRKLSQKLGGSIKLPTEAQWEYACRAGTTTSLYNGEIKILGANNAPMLDPIAWYGGNSMRDFNQPSNYDSSAWDATQYPGGPCGTHPVGKKCPNSWGLYDMIGNVWEWCQDWYGSYPTNSVTDPTGPNSGSYRVNRGGSWSAFAKGCRSAGRSRNSPERRDGYLGLRVLLEQ